MRNFKYLLAQPEDGFIGEFKPLVTEGTPPGAIGNMIFVPILAVALWFSLPRTADSLVD